VEDPAPAPSSARAAFAVAGLGVAGGSIVFGSATRLPLWADDYQYLATVQTPGWWHSRAIWDPRGNPFTNLFRPVLFLWFGFVHGLFGLHSVPIHVATGLIVFAAAVLTGLVARRLGLGSGAYAAAVVYGLHATMAIPIAWTAAASSPLATTLALGALYCMLRPRLRGVDVIAACGLLLGGLMTREVVAVTPAVLIMARYAVEAHQQPGTRLKRSLVTSLPLWLVLIGYATVRRLAGFVTTAGPYQQRLTTHAFRNFGQLMEYATEFGYSRRYGAFVVAFWVVLIGLCGIAALRFHRSQGLVGLAWIVLGVLPVVFLAVNHMQYYYFDFALPGLALAVGTVFECVASAAPKRARIALTAACMTILVALSSYTAREELHTFVRAADRQEKIIVQVRRDHPHPAPGTTIVLPISAATAGYADYPDAIRVIFHDPTLQVAYSG
jgi:hypothetical protein